MRQFVDSRGNSLNTYALEALRSHDFTLVTRVTALYNGSPIGTVEVTDGSFDSDEGSTVRDRCTVQFPIEDASDPAAFDQSVIDVTGYRFQVDVGVELTTAVAYCTLGTFPVWTRDDVEGHGRLCALQGYDVTALLRDARFETTYAVAAGTNYATALAAICTNAGLQVLTPSTPYTTPLLVFEEGTSPLDAVRQMAASCGWEVIASPLGEVLVRPVQSNRIPVWEFVEGDGCRMTELARSRTRDQVYNIAVVTGQPAGGAAPVRGVAYDSDPESPTFVTSTQTGPFGRVPVFERSEFVTTSGQAQAAAAALLARKKGTGSAYRITAFTNPALECGDPTLVQRSTLNVSAVVPLRSTTINLAPNQLMSAVTREAA